MKRAVVIFLALSVASTVRGEWKGLVGEQAPPLEISSWVAAPEGESLGSLWLDCLMRR